MKGALWNELVHKLNIEIDDPLLQQSLFQEVFEMCLCEHFASCNSVEECCNESTISSALTSDELNVMRYACGYVPRSLLKKYEQKTGEVNSQYATCLGEMAVEGGEDFLSYSRRWFELVNRGGLYPLHNEAFHLFIEIEKCVRFYLPKHALRTEADKESFKRNVHDNIFQNEDVQFHWGIIIPGY